VDAAICDGTTSMMSYIYGFLADGSWTDQRESNRLDGGAHFYNVYRCADGKWISIAAYEAQFYRLLREKLALTQPEFDHQLNRADWPALRRRLEEIFAQRSRSEWCSLLEGTDVCFAPVLDLHEAPQHPHNVARQAFVEIDDIVQPAPAPRFSKTPGSIQGPPAHPGEHNATIATDWGIPQEDAEHWLTR
jgi:alpha-methylacyl-CoA racemase